MSDALFTIKSTGPMRGDCTQPFRVIFSASNPHPTVAEFIVYVGSRTQDWGQISIAPDSDHTTIWSLIGHRVPYGSIDYKWGDIHNEDSPNFIKTYGSRKIKSATADGGWGAFDYVLLLEDE